MSTSEFWEKVDSNQSANTLIRVCGCGGKTQDDVACSEIRISYHKTSKKFEVTRVAPRLCTLEMKASKGLGSTNYSHEMLVSLCVQQTTDVNQVMPKRLRAVLRLYCVLELGDTWLSHLAEKVRHAKLGVTPEHMLAQVPAYAEALRRKGWVVDLEIVWQHVTK